MQEGRGWRGGVQEGQRWGNVKDLITRRGRKRRVCFRNFEILSEP